MLRHVTLEKRSQRELAIGSNKNMLVGGRM